MPITLQSAPKTIHSNFRTLQQVREAMTAKLKDSCLSASDARSLHIAPFTAQDVAAKLPALPFHRAGFKIPYFDAAGTPNKFFRFRYLEYDNGKGFGKLIHGNGNGNGNGNGVALKHDLRYVQPASTLPGVYLPPLVDWEKVIADPDTLLVITEGELKSACACKHGLATIGLGGVWSFTSRKAEEPLLPALKEFQWKDRHVYICYDSDTASNPNVARARNSLCRELTRLGAVLFICTLPTLEGQKKTGLDDYIASEGLTEFKQKVMDPAEPWRATEALHRLNGEVLYVRDPGMIIRVDSLQRMSPRAFMDHAYSDRIWTDIIPIGDKGGTKRVERSAPKEWIKWPHRATVERLTYAPGKGQHLEGTELNTWPGWGLEPVKGNVDRWHALLDYLFADHEDAVSSKRWFQQWLAYPLQHPGTKLNQSVVMWSVTQGTGKTIVGYTMRRIYDRNFSEINDKSLQSGFNAWAENKQFVMGDEIASSGERKRDTADRMKSMITQRHLRVNAKYVPEFEIPDCINYYFTSNHPDAFFMEDTDRRFFINEVRRPPLSPEFYTDYCNWALDGEGAAAVFYHLLHLDLEDFNPQGHAPSTASKLDMIDSSRGDMEVWTYRVKDDPDAVLRVGGVTVPYTIWTTEELYKVYDPEGTKRCSINGLSRGLKRAGIPKLLGGEQVRTVTAGIQRLWAIRNRDELVRVTKPAKIAFIFDKEREFKKREVKF